jgi:hypothetical protein
MRCPKPAKIRNGRGRRQPYVKPAAETPVPCRRRWGYCNVADFIFDVEVALRY